MIEAGLIVLSRNIKEEGSFSWYFVLLNDDSASVGIEKFLTCHLACHAGE